MFIMPTKEIYDKWMETTQKEKIEQILKHVEAKERILDIGSGPGFLEEFLPAVAIDIDMKNLKKAKGLKVLGDASHLPFKKDCFKTIFCIDIVHLLEKGFLAQVKEILDKNGIFIISIFCNRYNSKEKLDQLKNKLNGFKIKESFIVKAKQEWDAVVICSRPGL